MARLKHGLFPNGPYPKMIVNGPEHIGVEYDRTTAPGKGRMRRNYKTPKYARFAPMQVKRLHIVEQPQLTVVASGDSRHGPLRRAHCGAHVYLPVAVPRRLPAGHINVIALLKGRRSTSTVEPFCPFCLQTGKDRGWLSEEVQDGTHTAAS